MQRHCFAAAVLGCSLVASGQTIIGRNFVASTMFVDSTFIPPDSMGAVGVDHFVELINGRYSVYRKSDGVRVQTRSLNQFWTVAGAAPTSNAFDPRVLYDPHVGRWYAAAVDNGGAANSFLFAISATSDPTGTWTGFKIDADADNSHWADFPMMGYNAEGVFLSANMAPIGAGSTRTGFVVLPKVSLLAPVPSTAGMTTIQDVDLAITGATPQLAVDTNNAIGVSMPVLSQYNTGAGVVQHTEITPPGAPVLSPVGFIGVPAAAQPPTVDQPGPKNNLAANDTRFSGNTVLIGNNLWAVQCIDSGGKASARWFRMDMTSNTVAESGVITDPALAFTFPSINVNEFGDVVIGFTGTSTTQFASSYAIVGKQIGATTTFGSPILLHAGASDYQRLDGLGRNRWGDYSATTIDPADPAIFWTEQEYVVSSDVWSTRATELIILQANEARWADPLPTGNFDDATMWNTTHGGAPIPSDRVVFSRATDPASPAPAGVVFPPQPPGVYANESASIRQGHWRLDLAGNQWDLVRQLDVGPYAGAPRATLANGTLDSNSGFIAVLPRSRGELTLENARWNVANLAVGGVPGAAGGSGTLNLVNQSSTSSTQLRVWQAGRINLVSGSIDTGTLEVAGGRIITSPASPANVIRCTDIQIHSGGVIDLANNFMVVDYTGPSAIPPVMVNVLSGWAGGAWNGPGINSSVAAGMSNTGIGVAEATDLFTTFPALYRGQVLDSTAVLVKYTYYGDATLDGQVDISDLAALATNWQTPAIWSGGDFNYSGFVDISDLALLATNWQAGVGAPLGQTFEQALASVGLSGVAVPEPGCALLLPALGLLRRRRALLKGRSNL